MNYVIFVELEGLERPLTDDEQKVFDKELGEITYPYKSFRNRGTLQMPQIYTVKAGTFDKLKQAALLRNKAISNQYKTPRYLKDETNLSLLVENIIDDN